MPPWSKGWHTATTLDYAFDLGLHSGASFAPKTKTDLGAIITAALPRGAKVSAFIFGFDTADGGHSTLHTSQFALHQNHFFFLNHHQVRAVAMTVMTIASS